MTLVKVFDRKQDEIRLVTDSEEPIIWLNRTGRYINSGVGVVMTPEEAVSLAKMLYKMAYYCGYESEAKK